MRLSEIKIGTAMQIEIETKGEHSEERVYLKTKVLKTREERFLTLEPPVYQKTILTFREKESVKLFFLMDGKIYFFKAIFSSYANIEGFPAIELEILSRIENSQRRMHYRVGTFIPIRVIRLPGEDGFTLGNGSEVFSAIAKDISGGGMRLHIDKEFRIGENLGCTFSIYQKEFRVPVIVKWTSLLEGNLKFRYEIGVSFDGLEESDKEEIIKYVFREQRKMLSH